MKNIKDFVTFKEAFKPKRLAGREEEAEKKGLVNWVKKAKSGEMKDFGWFEGEPEDVVFDDISQDDNRVCVLMAVITHKDIIKYRDLQKGDYMLVTLHKQEGDIQKPWVLTIEDQDGSYGVHKERFKSFEEARIKMKEYFDLLPEIQEY